MYRDFNWLHMEIEVYATVRNHQSCARNRRVNKRQCRRRLLPPKSPLESVGIHILGLLPKKVQQPVRGGHDRPLLKTYKDDTDGYDVRNNRCHHLTHRLTIELRNTRQSPHQQWHTIRVYVFQDNSRRTGDHAVNSNGISPPVQGPDGKVQDHHRFKTTLVCFGMPSKLRQLCGTTHLRIRLTSAPSQKPAPFQSDLKSGSVYTVSTNTMTDAAGCGPDRLPDGIENQTHMESGRIKNWPTRTYGKRKDVTNGTWTRRFASNRPSCPMTTYS